ncbi:MAG: sigma 54-interacting transcriptional regulator [Thiohalocapsa sp.]
MRNIAPQWERSLRQSPENEPGITLWRGCRAGRQRCERSGLGGGRARHSDARVVAASNADLRSLCERGALRADLFFRLDTLSVTLPPLRERVGDMPLLAAHFAERFCRRYGLARRRIDPGCLAPLEEYSWPGNVRELENLVHREVLLAPPGRLLLQPERTFAGSPPRQEDPFGAGSFAAAKARAIEAFERDYLTRLMAATGGNVTQAARRAEKERRTLGRLLKKHRIGVAASER